MDAHIFAPPFLQAKTLLSQNMIAVFVDVVAGPELLSGSPNDPATPV